MGIGPKQEKEQSKKRKASKEMKEPAKRAKTEAKNIIKTTTKRLKLRSAVARSSKTKQQDPNSSREPFSSTKFKISNLTSYRSYHTG